MTRTLRRAPAPKPMPDGPGFEAYYARWRRLALRVARGFTSIRPDLADQFESAALCAVWRTSGRPGAMTHRHGILVIVAARRGCGRVLHRHRVRAAVGPLTADAPDRTAGRAVEAFDLADLLGALPERERDAVRLRFLDGLKLRECGERLGTSGPWAWHLADRGVEALKLLVN